jgi:hypothetical protein
MLVVEGRVRLKDARGQLGDAVVDDGGVPEE